VDQAGGEAGADSSGGSKQKEPVRQDRAKTAARWLEKGRRAMGRGEYDRALKYFTNARKAGAEPWQVDSLAKECRRRKQDSKKDVTEDGEPKEVIFTNDDYE